MKASFDLGYRVRFFGVLIAVCIGSLGFVVTSAKAGPRDTIITTVMLGTTSTGDSIVLDPKMQAVYVCCALGTIYGVDTNTYVVSPLFQGEEPFGFMGISPDGRTLYFEEEPVLSASLAKFSIAQKKVLGTLPVSTVAAIPTVSPDGSLVYLPDYSTVGGTVRVVSTSPFSQTGVIGGVTVPNPYQAVFTPDGAHAYITNIGFGAGGGNVSVFEVATGASTVITSPKFNQPFGAVISNDGSKLYVTQQDVFNDQGIEQKGVVAIDTATNTVGRSISVAPSGANTANWDVFTGIPAITPDGAYVYVPISYLEYTNPATGQVQTYDGRTVAVINTNLHKVIDQITLENVPVQVAISPNGKRAYVLDYDSGAAVTVIDIAGS
jgi:DNA-binding beta-propeller fold protein YncE